MKKVFLSLFTALLLMTTFVAVDENSQPQTVTAAEVQDIPTTKPPIVGF